MNATEAASIKPSRENSTGPCRKLINVANMMSVIYGWRGWLLAKQYGMNCFYIISQCVLIRIYFCWPGAAIALLRRLRSNYPIDNQTKLTPVSSKTTLANWLCPWAACLQLLCVVVFAFRCYHEIFVAIYISKNKKKNK